VASVRIGDRTLSAVDLTPDTVQNATVVLMLTDHTAFDRQMIAANASLIVDTRNAFKAFRSDKIVRI
jgi:UDP-N-acetyl-D-glucosamine dehydrogenase